MPRKKLIDSDNIRLEKVDKTMIAIKNCLQAKLVFKTAFTPKQLHTLRTYYSFDVFEENHMDTITVNTYNSWKGLVLLFLSLAYCKFEWNMPGKLLDVQQYTITSVSFQYEDLLWEHTGALWEQSNEAIEQIAAPPSWAPCYVRGKYKDGDISRSLNNFIKLLDIDEKNSFIKTENSQHLPHEYKNRPAVRVHNPCLLSENLKIAKNGITFVHRELYLKLFGNRMAQAFSAMIRPDMMKTWRESEDDPMKPVPLYGYQMTPENVPLLCEYFPFIKYDIISESRKPAPQSYVLFDRIYLGRFG